MTVNPAIEKKNLLFVLGLQNPTQLLVSNATTAQVFLFATVSGQPVNVLLAPPDPTGFTPEINLLDYAPVAAWRSSDSLFSAVDNALIRVDISQDESSTAPTTPTSDCCGITSPPNAQTGDILVFEGGEWQRLTPGPTGEVLTSSGPGVTPIWSPGGAGGLPTRSGDPLSVIFEGASLALYRRIHQSDIIPNIAINTFPIASGSLPPGVTNSVERGTQVTPQFNAVCNVAPTSATLDDNVNIAGPANVLSFFTGVNGVGIPGLATKQVSPGATFQTATYSLLVGDGTGTATANQTFTWGRRLYVGVSNHAGPYTMVEIQALASKAIATSRTGTFNVTPGAGQYIVYASLSALGTPTFTINGFSGGFTNVTTTLAVDTENVALAGATVVTENYQVWQSDNPNLGVTTLVVS